MMTIATFLLSLILWTIVLSPAIILAVTIYEEIALASSEHRIARHNATMFAKWSERALIHDGHAAYWQEHGNVGEYTYHVEVAKRFRAMAESYR